MNQNSTPNTWRCDATSASSIVRRSLTLRLTLLHSVLILVDAAAAAFYVERHKPLLSGSFKLVGSGTVSGTNDLGFMEGYGAQTIGTISSASRTGSVVTITTGAAHGDGPRPPTLSASEEKTKLAS
jgi:hypothetical protein